MLTFKDEELDVKLQKLTGTAAVAPARFYSFTDLEENTREQIQKVKSHPWIPKDIPVRGFVYDVNTGRMQEVTLPSYPLEKVGRARWEGEANRKTVTSCPAT